MTLVRENGKTLAEARVEVAKSADFLDYYASFARQPWGEILADARGGTQTTVRSEPVGVVLAITPWNDPLLTPARKLGPALIAGNAVLLKPSRQTPLIAAVAGRPARGGWPARGRAHRGHRAGAGHLRGAAGAPGAGRPDLHRIDRNRPPAAPGPGRPQRPAADRDRREERLGRAGGRGPGPGRRHRGRRRVRPGGPAVHRDQPADRGLRRSARAAGAAARPGGGLRARPGPGPGDHARPAGHPRAPGRRAGARRAGPGRGGRGDHRRRPAGRRRAARTGATWSRRSSRVDPGQSLWRDEVFGPVVAVTPADRVRRGRRAGQRLPIMACPRRCSPPACGWPRSSSTGPRPGRSRSTCPRPGGTCTTRSAASATPDRPFKEQGAPGLRFYTRLKTAAVRYAW